MRAHSAKPPFYETGLLFPLEIKLQETTKDLKVEGSRSQQKSVTDHPPLSERAETQ